MRFLANHGIKERMETTGRKMSGRLLNAAKPTGSAPHREGERTQNPLEEMRGCFGQKGATTYILLARRKATQTFPGSWAQEVARGMVGQDDPG